MIITIAWPDEESVLEDPTRHVAVDFGERHKFKSVQIAKSLCWALKGDEIELAKAHKYAASLEPPGTVFTYPPATKDPLAKARQDLLDSLKPVVIAKSPRKPRAKKRQIDTREMGYDPSTGEDVRINPGYAAAPENFSARALREATDWRRTQVGAGGVPCPRCNDVILPGKQIDHMRQVHGFSAQALGAAAPPAARPAWLVEMDEEEEVQQRREHKHNFDCLEDKTGRVICGKG